MKEVLLIGGAGFIGSHTTRLLLDAGYAVTVLDAFKQAPGLASTTALENTAYRRDQLLSGAEIVSGDTAHAGELARQLINIDPGAVISLAAQPQAHLVAERPEEGFASIVAGTQNLLNGLRLLKPARKLVYVSSSMIYGDFEKIPVPEDNPRRPKNLYGGMKLAAEILVKTFCTSFDLPCCIVRPSAVYGPTNNNRSVLQLFVEGAIRGQPLRVTSPGDTALDFTYVEDVAGGLMRAFESGRSDGREYNLTFGETRTLGEAVEILRSIFPDLTVEIADRERPLEPRRGALDISRARAEFRYRPRYPLEKGLKRYVSHVHNHNPSLQGSTS